MDDDFNTPQALAVLFDLSHKINQLKQEDNIGQAASLGALLRKLGNLFGILQQEPHDFLQGGFGGGRVSQNPLGIDVSELGNFLCRGCATCGNTKCAKDQKKYWFSHAPSLSLRQKRNSLTTRVGAVKLAALRSRYLSGTAIAESGRLRVSPTDSRD